MLSHFLSRTSAITTLERVDIQLEEFVFSGPGSLEVSALLLAHQLGRLPRASALISLTVLDLRNDDPYFPILQPLLAALPTLSHLSLDLSRCSPTRSLQSLLGPLPPHLSRITIERSPLAGAPFAHLLELLTASDISGLRFIKFRDVDRERAGAHFAKAQLSAFCETRGVRVRFSGDPW